MMERDKASEALARTGATTSQVLHELKGRLKHRLLERLDRASVVAVDRTQAESRIRSALQHLLDTEPADLPRVEHDALVEEIGREVIGLGPLDPLLEDHDVSDILVNGPHAVYVEKAGRLYLTDVKFRDEAHLIEVIDRIVSAVGRRIDHRSPMVDARLPDGSRVNAIIPPLALDGPALSIRRFGKNPYKIDDLMAFGALTPAMLEYLRAITLSRLNVMISGGTGSGKTTLLNCLASFIPGHERVVTIEDSAELQLQQAHVVRLETRPPDLDGVGGINQRDLVRNALRMRPDRIVVGEVRAGEVLDMLQAMNTGHDGSLTTVHANSPRDCLARIETLFLMAGIDMPIRAIRQQVASAIQVLVHASRLADGSRKIVRIAEIVGMEGDVIQMQDLFEFTQTGLGPDGTARGEFRTTGMPSRFHDRLVAYGATPVEVRPEPRRRWGR
jgi:pilus assembly protein CpaF